MGSFNIWHWMIVLLVVLMIFGTQKLRNIGGDLGGAVKGFKEGVHGEGASATSDDQATSQFNKVQRTTAATEVKRVA